MKRILLIIGVVCLITMTQCKKTKVETVTLNNDKRVDIVLNVDRQSRVNVNPETGSVSFEAGDVIYVASSGKYIGTLTHDGNNNFVGSITNPTEGQPLGFFFLGNLTPVETLTEGTTGLCSVVITNQSSALPVISYATSTENYSSSVLYYQAH